MILGGADRYLNSHRSVWIFNRKSGSFDVNQPKMNHKRAYFGCTTFETENREVRIIGYLKICTFLC